MHAKKKYINEYNAVQDVRHVSPLNLKKKKKKGKITPACMHLLIS